MTNDAIAIIGIDCNFPGAKNKDEYWKILKEGTDVLANQPQNPYGKINYGMVDNIDKFDAEFFGINPKDADYMDPQQRLFLQSSWKAMEDAGINIQKLGDALVGVFAGAGANSYLMRCIIPSLIDGGEDYEKLFAQIVHGNSNDYLTSRVSYQLDLRGPSVTIQTACSSGLTALHFACRSLMMYECDLAICGGVSINAMQDEGYTFRRGEINSANGKCAPFSTEAGGTVFSGGVGTVILKRYEEACVDKDYIYGVIISSATGNDGANKVSYMAPSVDGQKQVIKLALDFAEVKPESIQYIEAHGTGTSIGDKIELQALEAAFPDNSGCYLGSVKGNIGHTLAAAGIAGLIKTVLCLDKGYICPSINSKEDITTVTKSRFHVNKSLIEWKKEKSPRRAGVSSFGMGGVNTHVILEEAVKARDMMHVDRYKYLKLSAKTDEALEEAISNLINYLQTSDITAEELEYAYSNRVEFRKRKLYFYKTKEELLHELEIGAEYEYSVEEVGSVKIEGGWAEQSFYKHIVKTINRSEHRKIGGKELMIQSEESFARYMKYLWEKGEEIDFELMKIAKIPVPTYSFEKRKHWIDFKTNTLGRNKGKNQDKSHIFNLFDLVEEKWKKYLGITKIERNDNFFELGGNSLLAIQIIGEIEDELAITLPMEKILLEPTVDGIYSEVKKCLDKQGKRA